jgi:hypothetical protein
MYPIPESRMYDMTFSYSTLFHEEATISRCQQLARQVLYLISYQRFIVSHDLKCKLQNYSTFVDASDVYVQWYPPFGKTIARSKPEILEMHSRIDIMNCMCYFADLLSWKAYWRSLEDSFGHIKDHFMNHKAGQPFATDQTKSKLGDLISCQFWTTQYSQFTLHEALEAQHVVFQFTEYPFYPFHEPAMDEHLDIFVALWELATVDMYDFNQVLNAMKNFCKAYAYPQQSKMITGRVYVCVHTFLMNLELMESLLSLQATLSDKTKKFKHVFDPEFTELHFAKELLFEFLGHFPIEHSSSKQKSLPLMLRILQKRNELIKNGIHQFKTCSLPNHSRMGRLSPELFQLFKKYFDSQTKLFLKKLVSFSVPLVSKYDVQRPDEIIQPDRRTLHNPELEDILVPSDRHAMIWFTVTLQKQTFQKKFLYEIEDTDSDDQQDCKSLFLRDHSRLTSDNIRVLNTILGKRVSLLHWQEMKSLFQNMGCTLTETKGSQVRIMDPFSSKCVFLLRPQHGIYRLDEQEMCSILIREYLSWSFKGLGLE